MKNLLLKHNYQWADNDFDTGIPRELLSQIIVSLKAKHVIAISGARRSGKSYLFRQTIRELLNRGISSNNIVQINFEDPFFVGKRDDTAIIDELYSQYMAMKNPKEKVYLFLDEIQNIANWQFWVRDLYDRDHKKVKIFLTGSNSDLLSTELATHLTGRVISYENYPFTYREYLQYQKTEIDLAPASGNTNAIYEHLYRDKEEIIHYLENSFSKGLFPEIASLEDEELITEILSQYFQNVIFSDIVPRFSIRNTKVIEELAYYLSTNFTSPYSYRKLAAAVGSNENTIKEYISYFEKAYLFYSVDYFEYSLKKQFRRNRKIYSIDNGLRKATSFSFSEEAGKYAENSVFLMLHRKYPSVYYWQDEHTNSEIDFVVSHKKKIYAINVTYTDDIHPRELEGFNAFSNVSKAVRNILITRNTFETQEHKGVTIELIPLWVFIFMEL